MRQIKLILSKMLANYLANLYDSKVKFSHINEKGYWEYAVGEWDYYGNETIIYYKTKGYKY